ncbi:MAG: hypothetical protein K0M40_22525 [Prolixibacteraceae bacterium]|nr:hypothetical protein [Prolixibacteraceae bacterium]
MKILVKSRNGLEINFSEGDDGYYLPNTYETLKAVGLPNTVKILDKVNDLLASNQHSKLLKGIAFIENIGGRETRKRLMRWMLLEFSCRRSIAINENVTDAHLTRFQTYINDLTHRQKSIYDIEEMIRKEDFSIVKIEVLPYCGW